MPQPTGGKVNASNLNVEGLDEVVTPLGTDTLMLGRDGVQNEKVPLSALAAAVIPDPLLLSDGTAAAPSLAFTLDIDTGLYRPAANTLGITANGAGVARFDTDGITVEQGSGPRMLNSAPSATVPSIVPNKTDDDTGIGRRGSNIGVLIAGNFNCGEFFQSSSLPQFIVPQVNSAGRPALAFGDGDTGFFEQADGQLSVTIEGIRRQFWTLQGAFGNQTGAWALADVTASATVPTVIASRGDLNSGMGADRADAINLIAGGLQCLEVAETGGAPEVGFYATTAIPLQTGVPVTAAAIHAALVALGLITA